MEVVMYNKMSDEQYMLETIQRTAHEYKCRRGPRPSGAMLVLDDGRKIAGFVEPTPGMPSCLEVGCEIVHDITDRKLDLNSFDGALRVRELSPHCVRNIHAEVNALLFAARSGASTFGATIYSINKPCYNCSKAIVLAGVTRIVYGWAAYDEDRTRSLLEAAGVECVQVVVEEPNWTSL
jgi:deoxycytidylate deaminase